jgi:hypothetical protein
MSESLERVGISPLVRDSKMESTRFSMPVMTSCGECRRDGDCPFLVLVDSSVGTALSIDAQSSFPTMRWTYSLSCNGFVMVQVSNDPQRRNNSCELRKRRREVPVSRALYSYKTVVPRCVKFFLQDDGIQTKTERELWSGGMIYM